MTGYTREIVLELLRSTVTPDTDGTSPFTGALARAEAALNQALAAADGTLETEPLKKAAVLIAETRRLAYADSCSPNANNDSALVFDISDLITFFSHSRVPTGIQRVQIETISSFLATGERSIHICCLIEGQDDWVEVPAAQFIHLVALTRRQGTLEDVLWIGALSKLLLALALAEPFKFIHGCNLINLGSSWSKPNYFLHIRHAKTKFGVRYISFVHDLIPIVKPEYCLNVLVKDFIPWMVGMFAHADFFLVGSEATKRDLLEAAVTLREPLCPSKIAVALDAWLNLLGRHNARKIPKLVCVGRNGWLNHEIYQRLESYNQLARHVSILSDLSDGELALLYRSCLFTIYPSFYEGWGLPVTESLCYGKAVITSDNSSLPEAGGEFAVYIKAGSYDRLAAAVETMIFDSIYRNKITARIETGFRARTWRDVAHQIDAEMGMRPVTAPQRSGLAFTIQ